MTRSGSSVKIGLGTVQFGLAYGVSNRAGKTPAEEVATILAQARSAGVSILDTAPAYGDSEAVLGASLPKGHEFRIVTKTPAGDEPFSSGDAARIENSVRTSLDRLRVDSVHGILVHTVEDLLGPDGDALFAVLERCRSRGWTTRIGASIYDGAQADALLDRYPIDIIQLPLNVLDQRLLRHGQVSRLKLAQVEIHIRSPFLQGLLLMDPASLHGYFEPIKPTLVAYLAFLKDRGLSPLGAALGFALGVPEVDAVICGVNDSDQFKGIVDAASPLDPEIFKEFSLEDEAFLNPSRWKFA